MSIYLYVLIGLVVFIIFIKMVTKERNDSSLLDSAKNRLSRIGDCCKRWFKGGA